jgi:hypothetical protein
MEKSSKASSPDRLSAFPPLPSVSASPTVASLLINCAPMKPAKHARFPHPPAPTLRRLGLALGLWMSSTALSLGVSATPATPSAADLEFFEKSIRPLLEEKCVECHSAAKGKTKGGLAMDTAAGLRKGGSSGEVLHTSSPDKSLLLKAVRYTDPDLQMPPEGKQLAPQQVALLEEWIRRGAPDPREGKAPGADPEAAKKHWAYQPISTPPPPSISSSNANRARNDIDRFILARLESKGIEPSPEADRATLLRRLSHDLSGLPPSPAEMQAFLADPSPKAYEQAVERLLASPRFGERWGRHWLDVARYSDTKGLPAPINADRRFHFAYSYRDYVIEAFNSDKPFNRFILEQLAADSLATAPDDPILAALGFLTVGRCFQNAIHEIIDDRIDVVTRGLMGISVACARCHDHKFDPISSKDYYALHGVFMSCEEPKERPVIGQIKESPQREAYLKKRAELLQKIEDGLEDVIQKELAEIASKTGDYLLATLEKGSDAELKNLQTFAGERKLVALPLSRWVLKVRSPEADPILAPWKTLSPLPASEFAAAAKERIAFWAAQPAGTLNAKLLEALQKTPPNSTQDLAKIYSQVFKDMAQTWEKALKAQPANPPKNLTDPAQEALRLFVHGEGAPCHMSRKEAEGVFSRKLVETRTQLRDKVDQLDGVDPAAPPRAMVLVDKATPVQPVVFIRGNPGNRGPAIPRQFIGFLSPAPKPFTKGSGRLELAEAIASPTNPLTARVAVNRIWLHLFNRGLVQTPNDFGVQTPPPTHPELLDYLASRFIGNSWSVKSVVRDIVLSQTYRQNSRPAEKALSIDPNNDLLHAQRRRRLDYEAMQDTLLQITGGLDETRGGQPVELTKPPFARRRSVYGYIDRQDLPSALRNFDFANPDISTGQRFATTVPQQALFLLNHPLVETRAKALAELPEIQAAPAGPPRIQALFQRVFQRAPIPSEIEAASTLLSQLGPDPLKPWVALSQVLLLSNETFFVD